MCDENNKKYRIPTHTVPSLQIRKHLDDMLEFADFLYQRNIPIENTRISRYIEYLKMLCNGKSNTAPEIFKNSQDGPYQSALDWQLYVLREVHELMWILKGIKKSPPKGVDEKLKTIVSGRDFAALDSNSLSRDTQFELRIASYFCQGHCYVDLSTETDIIVLHKRNAFFIECKRIKSSKQLENRLVKAKKQICKKMPRRYSGKITTGHIVADVTQIAFKKNGITMGMTDEHAHDHIQNKLKDIADSINYRNMTDKPKKVRNLWLQIHMPCLLLYPEQIGSRFSSYFVFDKNSDSKGNKACKSLYKIFENCSKVDERSSQTTKLKIRENVTVPKGSSFKVVDEDVMNQYLATGQISESGDERVIAELEMNSSKYEFTLFEFQMLIPNIDENKRIEMSKQKPQAYFELMLKMYLQRHRYEEE